MMKFPLVFLIPVAMHFADSFEYNLDPLYSNNTGTYQTNATIVLYKLQNITLNREYFNFSRPLNILSISIIRTSIESLENNTFENFTNLLDFTFSFNSGLGNLPDNLFLRNTKIKSITAVNNMFHHLNGNTFSHLLNLEQLDMSSNQISELPVMLFNSLLSLRTVSLKRNNLKELQLGLFDDLIELRSLDLSFNDLKRINPHIFKYNYRLESVDLQGNKIKKLEHAVLHLNVKVFNLIGNPLEKHENKLLEILDGLHAQGVKTGVHQKEKPEKPHHVKYENSTFNILVFGLIVVISVLAAFVAYMVYVVRMSMKPKPSGKRYYGMRTLSTQQLQDEDPWLDTDVVEDRRPNVIVNASV